MIMKYDILGTYYGVLIIYYIELISIIKVIFVMSRQIVVQYDECYKYNIIIRV